MGNLRLLTQQQHTVDEKTLEELQIQYPHLNVEAVLLKLINRYGQTPTLAALRKWLDTEKDPTTRRKVTRPPAPVYDVDGSCKQCEGSGFVGVTRNGIRGRLARLNNTGEPVLIRCDHKTIYE